MFFMNIFGVLTGLAFLLSCSVEPGLNDDYELKRHKKTEVVGNKIKYWQMVFFVDYRSVPRAISKLAAEKQMKVCWMEAENATYTAINLSRSQVIHKLKTFYKERFVQTNVVALFNNIGEPPCFPEAGHPDMGQVRDRHTGSYQMPIVGISLLLFPSSEFAPGDGDLVCESGNVPRYSKVKKCF